MFVEEMIVVACVLRWLLRGKTMLLGYLRIVGGMFTLSLKRCYFIVELYAH